MDPHALLGVRPDATPEEITAAYRQLAKEWHPDLAGTDAGRTMALINAAYDLLRAQTGSSARRRRPRGARGAARGSTPRSGARSAPSCWARCARASASPS